MHTPSPRLPYSLEWIIPAILVIVGWAASGFMTYHHDDVDLTNRVTAVETQQRSESARLDRIENKLDRLFEVMTGHRP